MAVDRNVVCVGRTLLSAAVDVELPLICLTIYTCPGKTNINLKSSGQECPLHTKWKRPFNAGDDLLSHTLSPAVQSALRRLT